MSSRRIVREILGFMESIYQNYYLKEQKKSYLIVDFSMNYQKSLII